MATKGIHVNVYKLPDGTWRCDLKLNTNDKGEGITVRGTSDDSENVMGFSWSALKRKLSGAGQALAKARMVAKAILSNPAVAQAFPQYVAPALSVLAAVEAAEKHGKLSEVKKQLTDPTLKKLTREMDEMSKGQRSAMSGGGVCLCDGGKQTRAMRGARVDGLSAFDFAGLDAFNFMGAPGPFGLDGPIGPFGLPVGNPHPWAQHVKNQIVRGNNKDPLSMRRLARMQEYQRRMARNAR